MTHGATGPRAVAGVGIIVGPSTLCYAVRFGLWPESLACEDAGKSLAGQVGGRNGGGQAKITTPSTFHYHQTRADEICVY